MLNLTVYGYVGNVAAVTTALMPTTELDRSACPARSHGNLGAYTFYGCRCGDARAENTRHRRRQRAGELPPRYMDATGTRRRLRALVALGWGPGALAGPVGLHRNTLEHIAAGRWRQVAPATARVVAQVYERLSMAVGPQPYAARLARRRGWVPPLMWEGVDIDDPAVAPEPEPEPLPPREDIDEVAVQRAVDGWPVSLNLAEQREAIARLWRNPEVTVAEIAHRVGSNPARVAKLAERRGWRRRDGSGGWLP